MVNDKWLIVNVENPATDGVKGEWVYVTPTSRSVLYFNRDIQERQDEIRMVNGN